MSVEYGIFGSDGECYDWGLKTLHQAHTALLEIAYSECVNLDTDNPELWIGVVCERHGIQEDQNCEKCEEE